MKSSEFGPKTIINDIKEAITEVVNKDFADNIELNENSKLSDDIELDSIEMTKVFEIIMNKYPEAPFIEWLSAMDVDKIIQLTISDITQFIAKHLKDE